MVSFENKPVHENSCQDVNQIGIAHQTDPASPKDKEYVS